MKKILFIGLLVFLTGCSYLQQSGETSKQESASLPQYSATLQGNISNPDFVCTTDIEYVCNKIECKSSHPYFYFTYKSTDKYEGIYERCDEEGCDSIDVSSIEAGIYQNVRDIDGFYNFFFKRNTTNSDFFETISMMDTLLIKYGTCKQQ